MTPSCFSAAITGVPEQDGVQMFVRDLGVISLADHHRLDTSIAPHLDSCLSVPFSGQHHRSDIKDIIASAHELNATTTPSAFISKASCRCRSNASVAMLDSTIIARCLAFTCHQLRPLDKTHAMDRLQSSHASLSILFSTSPILLSPTPQFCPSYED